MRVRSILARPWLLLPLALAPASCGEPSFVCSSDVQCEGAGPGAWCERSGACSVEDESCPGSGRRYAEGAGSRSGQCVDTSDASSSDSTIGDPGSAGPDAGPPGAEGTETRAADDGSGTTDPSSADATTTTGAPPPPTEVCDGRDNDGDGMVDEPSPDNSSCDGCELAEHDGFAYWACPDARTWWQAFDDCADRGAQLAVIESTLENDFITELADGASLWLGANDLELEGDWHWLDGTTLPLDHPSWGPDQPDDDGPLPAGEDCLHLTGATLFGEGDWNDDICDEPSYGALCKAPVP